MDDSEDRLELQEPAVHPSNTPPYEHKPALHLAAHLGAEGAIIGAVVSAAQNALGHHNRGAAGVLTRSGGTIALFGGMTGLFAFTSASAANWRQVDDPLNGAAGGCATGLIAGAHMRSLPVGVLSCAILGGVVGAFDMAGRSLAGDSSRNAQTIEEKRRRFFKRTSPFLDSLPDEE